MDPEGQRYLSVKHVRAAIEAWNARTDTQVGDGRPAKRVRLLGKSLLYGPRGSCGAGAADMGGVAPEPGPENILNAANLQSAFEEALGLLPDASTKELARDEHQHTQ